MDAGVALLERDLVNYAGPQRLDITTTALFQMLSYDRVATWVNENTDEGGDEASINRDHMRNLWGRKDRQGYSSDRTSAGQEALHGRAARGLSMVGGWPRLPGGEGGVCFGWGSATRSR